MPLHPTSVVAALPTFAGELNHCPLLPNSLTLFSIFATRAVRRLAAARTPHLPFCSTYSQKAQRLAQPLALRAQESVYSNLLFFFGYIYLISRIIFRLLALAIPPLDHKRTRHNGSLNRSHVAPKIKIITKISKARLRAYARARLWLAARYRSRRARKQQNSFVQ